MASFTLAGENDGAGFGSATTACTVSGIAANALLVAVAGVSGADTFTVSDNSSGGSLTWTSAVRLADSNSGAKQIFYAVAGASPPTTVSVLFSGGFGGSVDVAWTSDCATSPVVLLTSSTAELNTTSQTVTIDTTSQGASLMLGYFQNGTGHTGSVGTELSQHNVFTGRVGELQFYDQASAGSTTLTGSTPGFDMGAVAAAFLKGAGGGGAAAPALRVVTSTLRWP